MEINLYKKQIIGGLAVILVIAIVFIFVGEKDSPYSLSGKKPGAGSSMFGQIVSIDRDAKEFSLVVFGIAGEKNHTVSVLPTAVIVKSVMPTGNGQSSQVAGSLFDLAEGQNVNVAYAKNSDVITAKKIEIVELSPPPVITETSRYQVLSVKDKTTYRVKNLATGAELDLLVPSDARITGGKIKADTILKVNKSSNLGNGIMAFDLNIE